MPRLHISALTTLLFVTWLLAACGSRVSLTFEGNDSFQFNPSSAAVTAGAEVTVTFKNAGVLEHSWVLIPATVDPVSATESDGLPGANSGVLASGSSQTLTFTAPAAGTYQFICTVPGHVAAGMVGTVMVTD